MEVKQFTRNIRTDFNRLFCLAGVIPLLVFIYVLVNKISNINARVGEVGYIVMATIGVFVMGIVVGRKMLMSVTIKLIDDNQKILTMQQELLEKNRLAAITETVLALGDQINNPLLAISGNLELLDMDFKNADANERIRNRIETMRNTFRSIREVTEKLSKLGKPESVTIYDDAKMINLNKSK